MQKEIIVNTSSNLTDEVADIMWSIGASGVKILDPKDLDYILHSDTCWDYVDDDLLTETDVAKVSFFVEEEELDDKLSALKACLKDLENKCGNLIIEVVDVPEINWEEDWKKFYQPISAGKYTVMAEWLNDLVDGIIVRINPSKAFGTGEHASTRLCLRLMSEVDFESKHVIDVGAGSGILGIAAAKSGAQVVDMCDIDIETLECAKENSILNNVESQVRVIAGGITAVPAVKADVLLCNLTADILNNILDDLTDYIKEQGTLICSGILDSRIDELIENFTLRQFYIQERIDEGEWVGVKFTYGS